MILKSALKGLLGTITLLAIYFGILTLVSGWGFAKSQFAQNRYWILGLSLGFGVQIALFLYLKALHIENVSGKTIAASGTASTLAMVSCCAHYLVNILPIIGISGLSAIAGQYQTEFFAVGLLSNLIGIGYLANKIIKLKKL